MKERSYLRITSYPSRFAGFSILSLFIVMMAISGLYFGISTSSPLGYVIICASVFALISVLGVAAKQRYGDLSESQNSLTVSNECQPAHTQKGAADILDDINTSDGPDQGIFNAAYLLDSMDGDHESVIMILDVFLDEHIEDGKKFRQALIEEDRDKAQMIVHSLKGVSASLGVESLKDIAEQLENDIRDGVEQLQPLCRQLDDNLEKLKVAVSAYLQQHRSEIDQVVNDSTVVDDHVEYDITVNDVVIEEYDAAEPAVWIQREKNRPMMESITDEQWIDIDALVHSQNGDHDAVKILLDMFVEDNADDGTTFVKLVNQSGQETQAILLLHGLRGVAASINANPLCAKSGEIELRLKRHESVANNDCDSLIHIMDMTVKYAKNHRIEVVEKA
ncbi:Hpt domain-containing protein [Photobacterium nomapromontoriensis]|uniref:Hpt domain-containing protein n=1 Tax=Photobacterium nomapromontoriensis TaxID=2910237 RepID=UPI003D113279